MGGSDGYLEIGQVTQHHRVVRIEMKTFDQDLKEVRESGKWNIAQKHLLARRSCVINIPGRKHAWGAQGAERRPVLFSVMSIG